MMRKICFKCNIDKDISEYYKHKGMGDGHLGKCKECTRKDSNIRDSNLREDKCYIEKEKIRAREKYYRLGYKDKHKPSAIDKKEIINRYSIKYPEKITAANVSSKIKPIIHGNHKHHWSYNIDHYKDLIELTPKHHAKIHRYIIYDQERFMYRRYDTNELLDTKENHIIFINWCIENKQD